MQITFDLLNQKVTVEGEGVELAQILTLVREIAPDIRNIQFAIRTGEASASTNGRHVETVARNEPNGHAATNGPPPPNGVTLRDFARSVNPKTMYERAAVVAYYLREHEGRATFSPKDLDQRFAICGFQKPRNMAVMLNDCRRRTGYVENVKYGEWRLARDGDNLMIRNLEELNAAPA